MVAFVTCGSEEEARKISELLVRERVAACVNIAGINSVFEWRGEFENQAEKLLIIKTVQSRFEELERLVRANHSYECPEILAVEALMVSDDYAEWVRKACQRN